VEGENFLPPSILIRSIEPGESGGSTTTQRKKGKRKERERGLETASDPLRSEISELGKVFHETGIER